MVRSLYTTVNSELSKERRQQIASACTLLEVVDLISNGKEQITLAGTFRKRTLISHHIQTEQCGGAYRDDEESLFQIIWRYQVGEARSLLSQGKGDDYLTLPSAQAQAT